jgi:5'-nucleotidase (lipoprotein e(P4) family)
MKTGIFILLVFCGGTTFSQDTLTAPQAVKIYPVLYQQTAAEYRALCYQAFNIAACRLQAIRKKEFRKHQLAIITDIDETILDNSPGDAQLIREKKEYNNADWDAWVNLSAATAVPGAIDFLRFAKDRGATIFYISNRTTAQVQPTLTNLRRLGMPDADSAHLLFSAGVSSKEARREEVAKQYKIIMLLGDNLADFTTAFEKGEIANRFSATDAARNEWGSRFIVLPNASYGDWESALWSHKRGLTPQQKLLMMLTLLRGFR